METSSEKKQRKNYSGTVVAVLLSWAEIAVLLLLVSFLISRGVMPLKYGKAYIFASYISGSLLGAEIMATKRTEKRIIAVLINTVTFLVVSIILGFITGHGTICAENLLYEVICVTLGSMSGCILSVIFKAKK